MARKPSAKLATLALGGLAAAGLVFATGMSGSQAQQQRVQGACFAHDELQAGLARDYQERQSAYGRVGDEAIMEIYASEGGTWTLVMTSVTGESCIVAAGDGWEPAVINVGRGA
ncbi:hypothetical protein [Kumtagia ephedrae]|jgi:hypothetical protein|uniref:Uncharacterized protein n=1 Tax=Kumtagia ephedrae TaxID=2116701 RepID=A0A2P7S8J9_9HYPH|nr:hypothetical protein [Mesorhizobium ephedrae]PSJ58813.1 hypothetical protein C7I84_15205 [Mesorhizobium ephedrae]